MVEAAEGKAEALAVSGPSTPQNLWRRFLRFAIHRLSYHFILKRDRTTTTKAAGFNLKVRPTVFHPRFFITSEYFAKFIGGQDVRGKWVAEVGCGSGIISLAAARAGAERVVAIDINPNAALTAFENAESNGLGGRVVAVCSNLMAAIAPRPMFDIILSSPPSFPGEPRDLADRAWHAGPGYRDIAALFEQARERLKPGGRMFVLLSSDSDLPLINELIARARLKFSVVDQKSIFIEQFIMYEVTPV